VGGHEDHHVVVVGSTVMPGSCDGEIRATLERASGRVVGETVGLGYSPEFIALGTVIRDFLNPDFLLVGESDPRAGDQLESCYRVIVTNDAPCRRMSLENAELAKIALNAYVTTKITFANTLADLCERIPGGDVDVVTDAIGLDRRIGRAYLTGGLGFGGPCFPRDNAALAAFAKSVGATADLAETTQRINERVVERIVDRVRPFIRPGTTVGVLGLAYKPASHVTEESQGLAIALRLSKLGATVVGYDPLVQASPAFGADHAIRIAESISDCWGAEVIVVANPDPVFRSLRAADFKAGTRLVVDCWRILTDNLAKEAAFRAAAIGRSSDEGITRSVLDRTATAAHGSAVPSWM
jgi:UDPglucose 6-dehydrogenase